MAPDGRIQYLNPALTNITGFSRGEVLDRRLTQSVRNEGQRAPLCRDHQAAFTGATVS
jgi:PAS domain S-box-containing protein